MTGISIGIPQASALILVALAGVLLSFRHAIGDFPVPLLSKPNLTGSHKPIVTTRAVHTAGPTGDTFFVDIWVPANQTAQPEPKVFPVVIYVPGWGNARGDNALLCAELASQGHR